MRVGLHISELPSTKTSMASGIKTHGHDRTISAAHADSRQTSDSSVMSFSEGVFPQSLHHDLSPDVAS